jgi:hypothetical protein
MDRDRLQAEYARGLHAEAERRFGPARAQALRQTIENEAGWMAEVATFPVDPDAAPAFYAEPAP